MLEAQGAMLGDQRRILPLDFLAIVGLAVPLSVLPMTAKFRPRLTALSLVFGISLGATLTSCRNQQVAQQSNPYEQRGIASWIHDRYHGHRTAFGGIYDRNAFTASSPSLPYGTPVRVTHLRTGRTVDVVIADRFYYPGRLIDLSPVAAGQLGMIEERLAEVSVVPLQTNNSGRYPSGQYANGYNPPPPQQPMQMQQQYQQPATQYMAQPQPSYTPRRPAMMQPYNPNQAPVFTRNTYSSAGAPADALAIAQADGVDFDFDEVLRSLLQDPPNGMATAEHTDFSQPNYEVQGSYPLPEASIVAR
jgi:rare lipoprotein A